MSRLLSISVNWAGIPAPYLLIDNVLSAHAGDWIRLSMEQWFVFSSLSAAELDAKIGSNFPAGVHYTIATLEPVAIAGRTSPWIWEWLNTKMGAQAASKFLGRVAP